jgi:hypothetical protein
MDHNIRNDPKAQRLISRVVHIISAREKGLAKQAEPMWVPAPNNRVHMRWGDLQMDGEAEAMEEAPLHRPNLMPIPAHAGPEQRALTKLAQHQENPTWPWDDVSEASARPAPARPSKHMRFADEEEALQGGPSPVGGAAGTLAVSSAQPSKSERHKANLELTASQNAARKAEEQQRVAAALETHRQRVEANLTVRQLGAGTASPAPLGPPDSGSPAETSPESDLVHGFEADSDGSPGAVRLGPRIFNLPKGNTASMPVQTEPETLLGSEAEEPAPEPAVASMPAPALYVTPPCRTPGLGSKGAAKAAAAAKVAAAATAAAAAAAERLNLGAEGTPVYDPFPVPSWDVSQATTPASSPAAVSEGATTSYPRSVSHVSETPKKLEGGTEEGEPEVCSGDCPAGPSA